MLFCVRRPSRRRDFNDNPKSIFRDQNFGINDLAAVQDVRNDFTQQDIEESTVIKDKGMDDVKTCGKFTFNHARDLDLNRCLAFFLHLSLSPPVHHQS